MKKNKKIAIAYLTRNATDLTDRFVERMLSHLNDYVHMTDIYVLENGSDLQYYSKYSNIIEKRTLGVGWGMNKLINHCYEKDYDVIWLNHNDAFVEKPKEFLEWSLQLFESDPTVKITLPWKDSWQWGLNCNELRGSKDDQNVSFWDHISTIFTREAIDITKKYDKSFTPFDDLNFGGHYLMLCPALALYNNGYRIVTNSKFLVDEINLYRKEDKEDVSSNIRGYGDEEWKQIIGPESIKEWFDKIFPNYYQGNYSLKQKRNMLINKVCELSRKK